MGVSPNQAHLGRKIWGGESSNLQQPQSSFSFEHRLLMGMKELDGRPFPGKRNSSER